MGYKQNIIFLDREAAGSYTKGAAAMSALGSKADIDERPADVRFTPESRHR